MYKRQLNEYGNSTLFIFVDISGSRSVSDETIAEILSNADLIQIQEGQGDLERATGYLKRLADKTESVSYTHLGALCRNCKRKRKSADRDNQQNREDYIMVGLVHSLKNKKEVFMNVNDLAKQVSSIITPQTDNFYRDIRIYGHFFHNTNDTMWWGCLLYTSL